MEGVDYLSDERKKAEFDVEAMKIAWAGSPEAFQLSDRMAKLVANDPAFEKFTRPMLGRKELLKNTLRKSAHAWKLIVDLRLSEEEAKWLRLYVDEPAFTDLHWGMFIPAIEGQGTEEQQKKWLPLAKKMQIIGCYAQTELGHGSNVQGLETTATFDPQTDEFIMHSPTLTSSKWWPGGLGKLSTHAVVYARLIVGGQFHGVHGFIVQLRSLEDHSPLPGITVGDIGLKFGNGAYNTMDNGVLRFDHVHIPRNQMLMRVSQVTREGKIMQSDVPRQLIYGTMVYVRQTIVADASKALSRAVCIATRYSAVRRQFGSRDGGLETQVIDYKTQQSRLFPLLASAYAFRFAGEWLKWLYLDVKQRLASNDFSTLPEAHACTAGLKSLTTTATADGIEECRKLCGGHGYLESSGLPELFAVYIPACTYEGDNVVLMLQVARFLVKTVSELGYKKPVGTTAYMGRVADLMKKNCTVQTAEEWLNPGAIVEAFESRAARMAVQCGKQLSKFENPEEGFAELAADLVEAAVAHCQLIVVSKFIEKLQQGIPGKGVKQSLEVLCYVYALFLLHKYQGDFLATGYVTPKQASLANEQLRNLYSKIRPNAIALVDSFSYTDHYLGSILGRYDGNVYPKLYEAAWKDPLNDTHVIDGFQQYIQPILKQKLHSAKL
ncbi:peroxisomal acyl-coenzyme A oxidase 1-like [Rutidosis leptorrhynchoides]|uniref:peroxisomal acyl-coenzyme A oxidase 1-like n=1 Tax=Rutidosis leptorrhynchoides TaxID=125765 RepID=UPI003A992EEC